MKVLHTADWHVGATLRRQYRHEEMREVLGEIVEIGAREEVDVCLLAGDVFEHKSPSAEAEDIVYEALLGLERAGIQTLIVPGNHDSPNRWKALKPLLERLSVQVVPRVAHPEHGGIVEFEGREGTGLQVAALPWIGKGRFVKAQELMGRQEEPYQQYAEGVANVMEALAEPMDPDMCHILAGHVFVSGAQPGGGERALTMGDVYAVDPQALPQVQYAALGHVHKPQWIEHAGFPTRYAGSPIQLDFGEAGHQKSVTIVQLEPRQPAQITEVPLTRGRTLRDVRGRLEELAEMQEEVGDSFLRVTVQCEKPEPGIGEQVRDLLDNVMEVRLDYPRQEFQVREEPLRGKPAREQFRRYLQQAYETEPEDWKLELFEELLQEVQQEED